MGDCGALTYVMEEEPPYSVAEVVDFYDLCGLDWGVSPDHIVFGENTAIARSLPPHSVRT